MLAAVLVAVQLHDRGAAVDTTSKTVDGTFDIVFDTGVQMGEFKGTFSAAVCPNATDIPLTAKYCE